MKKAEAESLENLAARIYRELPRNPAKALRLASQGVVRARLDPVSGSQARMTLCRAHALRESGQYAAALRDYDTAARLYKGDGLTEESWRTAIGKIDALDLMGNYPSALRVARKAARYFHGSGLRLWEAKIYQNMGNVYQHMDRYASALKYYRRAYPVLSRERPLDGMIALFNQANIHLSKGEPEVALDLLEQCRIFFQREQLSNLSGRVHYNLAYAYYLLGKYQDSLGQLSQATQIFRGLRDQSFLASCALDQAEVYLRLNRLDEAIKMAQRARLQFRRLNMPYELAESNVLLGSALLRRGKVSRAILHLDEARGFFTKRRNRVKSAELHSRVALAFLQQRKPESAAIRLRQAYRTFATHRMYSRMLSCLVYLADLLMRQGQWRKAATLLRKARPWIWRVRLPWVLLPYYKTLGKAEAEMGQKTAAQTLQKAIRLVENMRMQIPAEDLQISYLEDKLESFDILVSIRLKEGKIRQAFDAAERARSRVLLDLLEGSLTFGQEDEKLQKTLARLAGIHSESWRRSAGGSEKATDLEKTYENRVLLLVRAGQHRVETRESRTVPVDVVRKSLAPDQALISYYVIRNSVHAFLLDRTGLFAFSDIAGEEQLRQGWQLLHFQMERAKLDPQADPRNCLSHQNALGTQLLGPMYGRLQDKRLITIVPHGWLHGLPFHCLMHNERSLVERHAFSYAPSASVYHHCARSRGEMGSPLLFGYSDERAPFIDQELAEIHELYPHAKVFSGDDATTDSLLRAAPEARMIHIASHGRFRKDQPFFSGVRLSDGWLTLPQIYHLRLKAHLVTLSGCETGAQQISGGDELLGLTRGFLYAGASSLLVSLWRVSDRSTAFFMKQFYAALSTGHPKWQAWQTALLQTRKQWPHPYFWAPFLLLGHP